jgi:hypothetical protein
MKKLDLIFLPCLFPLFLTAQIDAAAVMGILRFSSLAQDKLWG